MSKKNQPSLLRILFCAMLFVLPLLSHAQKGGMNNSKWWMGMRGGINFTQVHPLAKYSVINSTSNGGQDNNKIYDKLTRNKGVDFGLLLSYHFTPQLSLSFQPAYTHYEYRYSNTWQWTDSTGYGTNISLKHHQKLSYIEIPLLVGFSRTFGIVTPYIKAGAFYGRLLSGKKITDTKEYTLSGGSSLETNSYEETFNLKDKIIASQIGVMASAGIAADINFFRLGLEVNYRYGLNNIVNVKNRYNDNRLTSGVYDVPDDIRLRNLSVYLTCSTPLDFLIHAPAYAVPKRKK